MNPVRVLCYMFLLERIMGHYSLLVLLAYFNLTGAQLSTGFIFVPIDQ